MRSVWPVVTAQEVIDHLEQAPLYQAVSPDPVLDAPVLQKYLMERAAQCVRTPAARQSLVPALKGKRVLDVGCELGMFGWEARCWYAPSHYVGLDRDETCINAATALKEHRVGRAEKRGVPCPYLAMQFIHMDVMEDFDPLLEEMEFDIGLCLSVYHHVIGRYGRTEARELLRWMGSVCEELYFDMGQKDEPWSPSRAYWHNRLPEVSPAAFIRSVLHLHGGYAVVDRIGESPVKGGKRVLYHAYGRRAGGGESGE